MDTKRLKELSGIITEEDKNLEDHAFDALKKAGLPIRYILDTQDLAPGSIKIRMKGKGLEIKAEELKKLTATPFFRFMKTEANGDYSFIFTAF